MKVRVDPTKCEAFGKCAEISAEFFKLDEYGYPVELDDFVEVPAAMEAKIRQAEGVCPTAAIIIEE